MRSLVISTVRPYPPASGTPLRVWHNIRVLGRRGPVCVFSFGETSDAAEPMPGVERWLHIDEDEYPQRSLAGLARLRKLVRPRQFPLQNDGITAELNARLSRFIADVCPDAIVICGWTDAIPDAIRGFPNVIVDAHNIESRLAEDLMRARSNGLSFARKLELLRFRRRERGLFRAAARIWVPSADDADTLARLDRSLRTAIVWPNVVDVDAYAPVRSRALPAVDGIGDPGLTFAYIGYYHYAPNARAAEFLIDEIFPLVAAEIPDVRLLLVGRKPTAHMRESAGRDARIVVTGGVVDTRPYLAAAGCCAVPLTEGGGTRLKILEAFAAGVPVVSTTKGAEGIATVDGREIAIADTPEAMSSAITDMLKRPSRYEAQTAAALELVTRDYSLGSLERRLDDAAPFERTVAGVARPEASVHV